MSEAAEILGALGLELDESPMVVELAHGVRLTGRRPTALDFSRARHAASGVLTPAASLQAAVDRYGFPGEQWRALADPDVWEGVAAYVLAVELALIVVTQVERRAGEGDDLKVWSVAPSSEAISWVLRQEGNLASFMAAAETAGREMIRPKKEPAPSPNGCSPAGAHTVADAGTSAAPAPGARP